MAILGVRFELRFQRGKFGKGGIGIRLLAAPFAAGFPGSWRTVVIVAMPTVTPVGAVAAFRSLSLAAGRPLGGRAVPAILAPAPRFLARSGRDWRLDLGLYDALRLRFLRLSLAGRAMMSARAPFVRPTRTPHLDELQLLARARHAWRG